MANKNINIKFNINIEHQLNKYIISYLANVDTSLQWNMRGIAGHKIPTQKELNELRELNQKVESFSQSTEGVEGIRNFSKECIEIYGKLLCNQELIHNYLEGKKIIFVAGAVRTGGTHLVSKMLESFDMKIEDYSFSMIHDDFPNYTCLYRWNEITMSQGLLFEMAQFLVWAKHAFKDKNIIIKKRDGFVHSLPFLYNIFSDNADYIVTVRHPIPSGFSIAKKANLKIDDQVGLPLWKSMALSRNKASEEEFDKMNCMERFLIYWQICYEDVVRCINPKQRINIVTYDEKSNNSIIEEMAKKHNGKAVDAGFKAIDREYPIVMSEQKVEDTIENVRKLWKVNGFEFPNLEIR